MKLINKIKIIVFISLLGLDFIVKSMILDKMQSEPEELVRRAICGVVSVLAAHLLKLGQWPEILERMNTVFVTFIHINIVNSQ